MGQALSNPQSDALNEITHHHIASEGANNGPGESISLAPNGMSAAIVSSFFIRAYDILYVETANSCVAPLPSVGERVSGRVDGNVTRRHQHLLQFDHRQLPLKVLRLAELLAAKRWNNAVAGPDSTPHAQAGRQFIPVPDLSISGKVLWIGRVGGSSLRQDFDGGLVIFTNHGRTSATITGQRQGTDLQTTSLITVPSGYLIYASSTLST